jgi:hypothetical protein
LIGFGIKLEIATCSSFGKLKTVYGQILGRVSRSVKKMSDRIAFQELIVLAFLEFLSSLRKSAHKPFSMVTYHEKIGFIKSCKNKAGFG